MIFTIGGAFYIQKTNMSYYESLSTHDLGTSGTGTVWKRRESVSQAQSQSQPIMAIIEPGTVIVSSPNTQSYICFINIEVIHSRYPLMHTDCLIVNGDIDKQ